MLDLLPPVMAGVSPYPSEGRYMAMDHDRPRDVASFGWRMRADMMVFLENLLFSAVFFHRYSAFSFDLIIRFVCCFSVWSCMFFLIWCAPVLQMCFTGQIYTWYVSILHESVQTGFLMWQDYVRWTGVPKRIELSWKTPRNKAKKVPSWERAYPIKNHFWRWFSFS